MKTITEKEYTAEELARISYLKANINNAYEAGSDSWNDWHTALKTEFGILHIPERPVAKKK